MEVPIPGFRSLSAAAGEGLEWDAPSVTEQREKATIKQKWRGFAILPVTGGGNIDGEWGRSSKGAMEAMNGLELVIK